MAARGGILWRSAVFDRGLLCAAIVVGIRNVPADDGRESNDRYQWPGPHFEAKFKGRSVYFKTGTGDVILHVLADGESLRLTARDRKPTLRTAARDRAGSLLRNYAADPGW